jgi:hypothetical protein|tara:strand:- start:76 stop:426 length:351 start_codon:yes stop_codon:yes gene_type:complete
MDKAEIKSNLKNVNQWTRILYMILFAVIFNVASFVIGAVVLGQALFAILTGGQNDNVQKLASGLAQFIYEIVSFLTYTTEEKPFPFNSWPEVEVVSQAKVEEVAIEAPAEDTDIAK